MDLQGERERGEEEEGNWNGWFLREENGTFLYQSALSFHVNYQVHIICIFFLHIVSNITYGLFVKVKSRGKKIGTKI